MSKLLYVSAMAVIATAMVLLTGILYLYFIDGNPPAELTLPYQTEKQVYAPGEALTIMAHTCKQRQYPLTTYPTLVKIPAAKTNPPIEGKLYQLPAVATVGTSAGCGDFKITGFFSIPKDLPPGRYYLKATNVFQVNSLRTRSLDWYTNEFMVLAPDPFAS